MAKKNRIISNNVSVSKRAVKDSVRIAKRSEDNMQAMVNMRAQKELYKDIYGDGKGLKLSSLNIGTLIFAIMFIALLFRFLTGGEVPTFASLLNRLQTMPTIVPIKIFSWNVDFGDWGVFDFILQLFEGAINGFGMFLGLIGSLLNCIPFIYNIVLWILVG